MLKELFISEVRVKMLRLFLLESDPERGIHVRDITRKVGTEINAVRRELDRLVKIKMIKRDERGNRVYYVLRDDFPLKQELLGMLVKNEGIALDIIKNSKRLGQVSYAVIRKEFLLNFPSKPNDVDIFLVGKVNEMELETLIKNEEHKRGSAINVSFLSDEEFDYLKTKKDPFVMGILTNPYYILVGDEITFAHLKRTV